MDTRDQSQRYTSDPADTAMAPDNTFTPAPPEMSDMLQGHALGVAMPDMEELEKQEKSPTPLQDSLRRLRRDKRAMISFSVIVFLVLLAIFGPPIYQHIGGPYNSPTNGVIGPEVYHTFYHQELNNLDQLPSSMYWLGTDNLGRDLLARLMQGLLISLSVALIVEVVDIVLGIFVGVSAGFYGGWIDQFLARFTDVMFAFPGILFVILLLGIFGPAADEKLSNIPIIGANGNARLLLVSLALAITIWPLMARYVRGQTLQLKEQQFIEAAHTVGTTNNRLVRRHIIPNLFSIVVVAATLNISNTIVAEAGISLLGLGVQPPGSSLGLMISNASDLIDSHPWEVIVPSVTLAIIVLAFSFFGDGLRDAFDPRSKD